MRPMPVDTAYVRNAAERLQDALHFAQKCADKPDADRDYYEWETCRTSVIQHFEVSFELAWKLMQRFLKEERDETPVNKRELFRLAAEHSLIEDKEQWFAFHLARNEASHEYAQVMAEETYNTAQQFAPILFRFLARIEEIFHETH